jgi:hypothetical protein
VLHGEELRLHRRALRREQDAEQLERAVPDVERLLAEQRAYILHCRAMLLIEHQGRMLEAELGLPIVRSAQRAEGVECGARGGLVERGVMGEDVEKAGQGRAPDALLVVLDEAAEGLGGRAPVGQLRLGREPVGEAADRVLCRLRRARRPPQRCLHLVEEIHAGSECRSARGGGGRGHVCGADRTCFRTIITCCTVDSRFLPRRRHNRLWKTKTGDAIF